MENNSTDTKHNPSKFNNHYDNFCSFWRNSKAGIGVFIISISTLIYAFKIKDGEVYEGLNFFQIITTMLHDAGVLEGSSYHVILTGALVTVIIGVIDMALTLFDWIYDRKKEKEKKIKELEKHVRDQAIRIQEHIEEINRWNTRRIKAERDGEVFDEPIPKLYPSEH